MPTETSPVVAVTTDDFTARVLESDRPVVVDFGAAWCAPCRVMAPIYRELATERDDVLFAKVDIDTSPELAARYGVLSAPTMIAFVAGQPVVRTVGSRPARRLRADLAPVLER